MRSDADPTPPPAPRFGPSTLLREARIWLSFVTSSSRNADAKMSVVMSSPLPTSAPAISDSNALSAVVVETSHDTSRAKSTSISSATMG